MRSYKLPRLVESSSWAPKLVGKTGKNLVENQHGSKVCHQLWLEKAGSLGPLASQNWHGHESCGRVTGTKLADGCQDVPGLLKAT